MIPGKDPGVSDIILVCRPHKPGLSRTALLPSLPPWSPHSLHSTVGVLLRAEEHRRLADISSTGLNKAMDPGVQAGEGAGVSERPPMHFARHCPSDQSNKSQKQ